MKTLLILLIAFDLVLHALELFGVYRWPYPKTKRGYDIFWTIYWAVALVIVLKI